MGCNGCKEKNREPRALKKEIPENKPTDPVVRPDGSLLYTGIAPSKEGYIHDPVNARRLIPNESPCLYRINAPLLDAKGNYSVMNDCNHPGHEKRGTRVTPKDCRVCVLRDQT